MLQVGLSAENALRVNIGAMALGLAGNILCWLLMAKFGRRPLFLSGLVGCGLTLFLIGILDSVPGNAVPWVQSGFAVLWLGIFSALVAPESYTIAGEVSATRVRSQTMSFSKAMFGFWACVGALIQIYLQNPTGVNIKGKTGYVW